MAAATHVILLTSDMQERRIAVSDVTPFDLLTKLYIGSESWTPKTAGTHALGWPIRTMECPAVVLDELMKIVHLVTTPTQAWVRLPPSLEQLGYTITEWRKWLSRYDLAAGTKRGRGEQEEEEGEEGVVITPARKKARVSAKAEPVLNPMELKAQKIGLALGAYIRDNHPDYPAFFNGTKATMELEIVGRLKDAVGVDLPETELDVPELGTIKLAGYWEQLDGSCLTLFCAAVGSVLHPCAILEHKATYRSTYVHPGDDPRWHDNLSAIQWPASAMEGMADRVFRTNTILFYGLTIVYKEVLPTKQGRGRGR
jgi:hypothetical protein